MLTEELIRAHYKHKCETGYDPLLCVHLEYWPLKDFKKIDGQMIPVFDPEDMRHIRHQYYHVDQVITEDRYVELIQKTNSSLNDLTDIDKIQVQNIWVPSQDADEEQAGIFWLKPTSKCKTLTDMFNVYEARIKIMFGSF